MNSSLRNKDKDKDESQVYGDSTFKTGLDLTNGTLPLSGRQTFSNIPSSARSVNFEDELLKLPNVVNYVALRETFLSEAPFVKRSNRPFWKKWIDSKQYMNVLAASLRLISDCITDNGVIYAEKLFKIPTEPRRIIAQTMNRLNEISNDTNDSDNIPQRSTLFLSRTTMIRPGNTQNSNSTTNNLQSTQNPQQSFQRWVNSVDVQALLIEKMAQNISEMLLLDRSKRSFSSAHDLLFYRLPELLTYMTLQALLSTIPKLARVFNSTKFREVILDWFTELINGMKITNSHHDREWIFKNTSDIPIILLNEPLNLSKSYRKIQAEMKAELKNTAASANGLTSALKKKGSQKLPAIGATNTKGETLTPFSPTVTFGEVSPRSGNRIAASFDSHDSGISAMNSPGFHIEQANTPGNNTDVMSVSTASTSSFYLNNVNNSRHGAARSNLILQNSPLVQLYMNMGKADREPLALDGIATADNETFRSKSSPYICQNPLKLTISHLPNRPIITMQSNVVHQEGKFREKKMNHSYLMKTLKESQRKRDEILQNKERNYQSMRYDVHKMNHAYKIQLAILDKKPVSQKEILAAATALEAIKLTSTGNSLTNLHASSNSVGGSHLESASNSVVTEN